MPKSRSSKDEKDKGDDKDRKGSRRRERSTSRDRKSSRRDRSRSEERSSKSGDKKDRPKRRNTDGEMGGSSATSSYSRGIRAGENGIQDGQPGSGSFSQFPGQFDAPLPGVPPTTIPGMPQSEPQHSPALSSQVPDMFPGQFPAGTSAPYRPPIAMNEGGPGLASEYYGDTGESVQHQPGVRPAEPTLIIGAEPHLMAALPVAAPPIEPSASGSTGAAASFYSSQSFASPTGSPKPITLNKPPNVASSASPMNMGGISMPPGMIGLGAAAAGAAAGYFIGEHGSANQENSQTSGHGRPAPNSVPHQNSFPSDSKPPRQDASPRHSPHPYAAAAGAAGLAAAEYNHHQQYHSGSHGPGYQNDGDQMYRRRQRGPFSKFVDFFRDPEGVAQYEEYSEYVGVCRYCFEPGSTPREAPRKHHYGRRRSSERYNGSSTRVDKEKRYYASDAERRNKGSSWVAGAATGLGLGAVGKSLFGQNRDFDDTYSVRTGRPDGASTSSLNPARRYSSGDEKGRTQSGVIRRSSTDIQSTSRVDIISEKSSKSRKSRRSRSRSRDRKTGATEAIIGAAVGSAVIGSSLGKRSSSPKQAYVRKTKSRSNSPSDRSRRRKSQRSSSEKVDNTGFFSGFFSSPPAESSRSRRKSKSKNGGFFSFSNGSSSSEGGLTSGKGSDRSRRRKSSSRIKTSDDAKAAVIGLGAATAALAAAESRKSSRRNGSVVAVKEPKGKEKSRHHQDHDSSQRADRHHDPTEDAWEDASEDGASSVDSALAFGFNRSQESLSNVSGTNKWDWRWRKTSSPKETSFGPGIATVAAAGIAGAAAGETLEYRNRRAQESNSSLPSMQYVEPVPSSDPRYYDTVDYANGDSRQRPAQVPIQQPQPITPVSPAVYKTQGPYDSAEYLQYQDSSSKRNGYSETRYKDEANIVTVEPKSRSRTSPKDPSSAVRFSFTEEQERRHSERDDSRSENKSRRESSGGQDSERRRRKSRRESSDRKEDERSSKDGSWVDPALVGVAGAAIGAVVAGEVTSKSSDDKEERRRRRREERIRAEEESVSQNTSRDGDKASGWDGVVGDAVTASAVDVSRQTSSPNSISKSDSRSYDDMSDVDREQLTRDRERVIAKRAANLVKRGPSPSRHEDYASYFAPDIISKPSEGKEKARDANRGNDGYDIVTIEPKDPSSMTSKELVFAGLEKFTDDPPVNVALLTLPWQVPPLRLINPSPPPELMRRIERDASPEPELSQKSSAREPSQSSNKGRVSFGTNKTHEYEVITPEEHREEFIEESDRSKTTRSTEEEAADVESPVEELHRRDMPGGFDEDIDFAATVAAGLESSGFDPNIVIEDPQYRRRDSPPGSNDDRSFNQQPYHQTVSDVGIEARGAGARRMPYDGVEDEELSETPKAEARSAAIETENAGVSQGSDRKKKKKKRRSKSDSMDNGDAELDIINAEMDDGNEAERYAHSSSKPERRANGNDAIQSNGTRGFTDEPKTYDSQAEAPPSTVSAPTAGEDEGSSKKKKKKRRSARDDDVDSVASMPAKIEDLDNTSSKSKKKSGTIFGLFRKAIDDASETRLTKEEIGQPDEPAQDKRETAEPERRSGNASDTFSGASTAEAPALADEDADKKSRKSKKEKRRSRQSEDVDEDTGRTARDLPSKKQEADSSEGIREDTTTGPSRTRDEADDEDESMSFLEERRKPAKPPDISDQLEDEIDRGRDSTFREVFKTPPYHGRSGSFQSSFAASGVPADTFASPPDPRRRLSMITPGSVVSPSTASPTAVPLHFRRHIASAGRSASATPIASPTTAKPRKARPLSTEFKSTEVRPLFLVERHQSNQALQTLPVDESYPSLPSSHSNSRASSVHEDWSNEREVPAEWDQEELQDTPKFKGKALDFGDTTKYSAADDLLDSQQVTPTAATFGEDVRFKRERDALEQATQEHLAAETEWVQRQSPEFSRREASKRNSGERPISDGYQPSIAGEHTRNDSSLAMALGAVALASGVAAANIGRGLEHHDSAPTELVDVKEVPDPAVEAPDGHSKVVTDDIDIDPLPIAKLPRFPTDVATDGRGEIGGDPERRLSKGMSAGDVAAAMATIASDNAPSDHTGQVLSAERQVASKDLTKDSESKTEAAPARQDGEDAIADVDYTTEDLRSHATERPLPSPPQPSDAWKEHDLKVDPVMMDITQEPDEVAPAIAEDDELATAWSTSNKSKKKQKKEQKQTRKSVTFEESDQIAQAPDTLSPQMADDVQEVPEAVTEKLPVSSVARDVSTAAAEDIILTREPETMQEPESGAAAEYYDSRRDMSEEHFQEVQKNIDDAVTLPSAIGEDPQPEDTFAIPGNGKKKKKDKKKNRQAAFDDEPAAEPESVDQPDMVEQIADENTPQTEPMAAEPEWDVQPVKKGKGKKNKKKERQATLEEDSANIPLSEAPLETQEEATEETVVQAETEPAEDWDVQPVKKGKGKKNKKKAQDITSMLLPESVPGDSASMSKPITSRDELRDLEIAGPTSVEESTAQNEVVEPLTSEQASMSASTMETAEEPITTEDIMESTASAPAEVPALVEENSEGATSQDADGQLSTQDILDEVPAQDIDNEPEWEEQPKKTSKGKKKKNKNRDLTSDEPSYFTSPAGERSFEEQPASESKHEVAESEVPAFEKPAAQSSERQVTEPTDDFEFPSTDKKKKKKKDKKGRKATFDDSASTPDLQEPEPTSQLLEEQAPIEPDDEFEPFSSKKKTKKNKKKDEAATPLATAATIATITGTAALVASSREGGEEASQDVKVAEPMSDNKSVRDGGIENASIINTPQIAPSDNFNSVEDRFLQEERAASYDDGSMDIGASVSNQAAEDRDLEPPYDGNLVDPQLESKPQSETGIQSDNEFKTSSSKKKKKDKKAKKQSWTSGPTDDLEDPEAIEVAASGNTSTQRDDPSIDKEATWTDLVEGEQLTSVPGQPYDADVVEDDDQLPGFTTSSKNKKKQKKKQKQDARAQTLVSRDQSNEGSALADDSETRGVPGSPAWESVRATSDNPEDAVEVLSSEQKDPAEAFDSGAQELYQDSAEKFEEAVPESSKDLDLQEEDAEADLNTERPLQSMSKAEKKRAKKQGKRGSKAMEGADETATESPAQEEDDIGKASELVEDQAPQAEPEPEPADLGFEGFSGSKKSKKKQKRAAALAEAPPARDLEEPAAKELDFLDAEPTSQEPQPIEEEPEAWSTLSDRKKKKSRQPQGSPMQDDSSLEQSRDLPYITAEHKTERLEDAIDYAADERGQPNIDVVDPVNSKEPREEESRNVYLDDDPLAADQAEPTVQTDPSEFSIQTGKKGKKSKKKSKARFVDFAEADAEDSATKPMENDDVVYRNEVSKEQAEATRHRFTPDEDQRPPTVSQEADLEENVDSAIDAEVASRNDDRAHDAGTAEQEADNASFFTPTSKKKKKNKRRGTQDDLMPEQTGHEATGGAIDSSRAVQDQSVDAISVEEPSRSKPVGSDVHLVEDRDEREDKLRDPFDDTNELTEDRTYDEPPQQQHFEPGLDSATIAEEAAWVEAERKAMTNLPTIAAESQFDSRNEESAVEATREDREVSAPPTGDESWAWSSKKSKKKNKKSKTRSDDSSMEQNEQQQARPSQDYNGEGLNTAGSLEDKEFAALDEGGVNETFNEDDLRAKEEPEDLSKSHDDVALETAAVGVAAAAGASLLHRSATVKKSQKKRNKKSSRWSDFAEEETATSTETGEEQQAPETVMDTNRAADGPDALRDSAVYMETPDSPYLPRSTQDIRDSGYQGSPMFSKYGEFDNEKDYKERTRADDEYPPHVSIEVDPDYDVEVSHEKTREELPGYDDELPKPRIREPSPVEPTTGDRASTARFSSSPSVKETPRQEYGSTRSMAHAFTPDREGSAVESGFAASEEEELGSLFGGPTGINSDGTGLKSPPKTPLAFEGTPLTTITEDSPEDTHSHKHTRHISDVGQPEHGTKARRTSISSEHSLHYPHRVHSPLNPENPRSLGLLSTEDLISRQSWPEVDDDREVVDLHRSKSRGSSHDQHLSSPSPDQARARRPHTLALDATERDRRSFSGDSVLSGDSINAYIRSPREPPSSSTPPLRRSDRSLSGDLRSASRMSQRSDASAKKDKPEFDAKTEGVRSNEDENIAASSSTYDPSKDKGKSRITKMADVYEAWGDAQGSPRSPTRPPSMRRRQSLQILDMETRLDQLVSENRLLQDGKARAERGLDEAHNDHGQQNNALQEALQTRDAYLRQKDDELEHLRETLEGLQHQVAQLTEANAGLTAAHAARSLDDGGYEQRYRDLEEEHNTSKQQWEDNSRELETLRDKHVSLSGGMEGIVRQEVSAAVANKEAELQAVREELEAAKEQVRSLQRQILQARNAPDSSDDDIVERDEDYFEAQCQKICQAIQTWVLRFSKYSDTKICKSVQDLNDEVIRDRFEDVMLDGSDVDAFLRNRIRRRDIFMAVVMGMVQQYVFMRYLFGMDREQRNKLKSLEKHLSEVGADAAVNRWRATTLNMLTRRPAFAQQRQADVAELVDDVYATLAKVLNPPSDKRQAARDGLAKVVSQAVDLSIEMRTQRARYVMLPPLAPEYDSSGDLTRTIPFNAGMMNERSGRFASNEQLQADGAAVRLMLFPLVVKRDGDADADDGEDVIVCPAQVLVAADDDEDDDAHSTRQASSGKKKAVRVMSAASLGTTATAGPAEGGMF